MTKKFDYDKGTEALWDLGHQDWEVIFHWLIMPEQRPQRTVFDFLRKSLLKSIDSLPCTGLFLGLLHIAPCQPCQCLQNQVYFFG